MHKKLFAIAAITLTLTGNFYALPPEQEAQSLAQAQRLARLHHQKFLGGLRGASVCLASCAAIGATVATTRGSDWRTGALVGLAFGIYPAVKISDSIRYSTGLIETMWWGN